MAMSPRQTLGNRDGLVYRPSAEINVTPLVDVTLVLLIIFMVAAPLMMTGVRVDLPHTSAQKIGQIKKPVIVTVAPDGSVYLRNEKVALTDLGARLDALRAAEGDAVVYIRADKGTDYGTVMDMLGRVNEAGYRRFSLLAQAPAKDTASP
ncbi:biopolymer transport protein TolR [Mesorhizobium soli]|uniref:ExbD/TolR family protein n=1 Tax=Pseudaminobacter soli (ex Li et al. 2025) TaxID=1295366 RepID=UPI0024745FA2|nr:ExbD/TolR family protein [Mesorhizobium soli]MDH6230387.1 biopolymer transport protein TolR [Mesorhizobium soli]